MADDLNSIRRAEHSETPHFDALFAPYDKGNGTIGVEHVGALLLDMGFSASPMFLECALDDMDPRRTGEIVKFTFLEWVGEHADEIDDTLPVFPVSPRIQRQGNAYCEEQSAMLDAKKQRKRVEIDAQLLANRLAHLRAEDTRAQKQIDDVKRRAREIEAMKRRNDAKQRVKQEALEQMQRDLKTQCEYNNVLQSSSRERRNTVIATYASQRAQSVQEIRAKKKIHLCQIGRQREMDRSWLAERSQKIRDQEKRAIRQRHVAQKGYEKEMVKKARDKLAEEIKKRLVTEKKIGCMEREEAELIARLRLTQELQRAAFEELEFVMQDN